MKIVVIVLQALAVAAGAYFGLSLKKEPPAATEQAAKGKEDGDKSSKGKSGGKQKKGGKGGGKGKDTGETDFMRFGRQFVVPVVDRQDVAALVILDLNLEISAAPKQNVYLREPKVRDALLTALLELSNEGAFGGQLLAPDNIDHIRERLLLSAKTVLHDDVVGVLILNIARQDV